MKTIYCPRCKRNHRVTWSFFGPYANCTKLKRSKNPRVGNGVAFLVVDDRNWTKVSWPT